MLKEQFGHDFICMVDSHFLVSILPIFSGVKIKKNLNLHFL
ncbi:hypothetical protein BAOM_4999 [Peribacillus asahii]|uniref:Uncharacterized protein n=1 Tax=Peribacillus asahii TaxID=228899 RepID=A0A3Q9RRK3_9BACI|nr:hypothetical protein BAOM_4999 [Peribacillus asahii]